MTLERCRLAHAGLMMSAGIAQRRGRSTFAFAGRQGATRFGVAAFLFRQPLPFYPQSMPLRFNAACFCLKPRLSSTFSPSLRSLQSSSIFLRRNCPPQRWTADHTRTFAAMAPKQATLGYVRSSQTTLGCGDALRYRLSAGDAMLTANR